MIPSGKGALLLLPLTGLLVVLASCIDRRTIPVGPDVKAEIVVRFLPQIQPELANTQSSTLLTEMQHEIHDANSLDLMTEGVVDIDQNEPGLEPSVEIELEIEVGTDVDIQGQIWLLNENGGIEWSGMFGPTNVSDDRDVEVWNIEVPVGRGDLHNHSTQAITLPGPGDPLPVGASVTLTPQIEEGPSNATLFWGSSNPGVATVAQSGKVTAVAPGEATISVASGFRVGTAVVTVVEG